MFRKKAVILTLVLVMVGLLIAMEVPSPSSAQVLNSTEAQLFSIARAAVLARNQILVGGDLNKVLRRDPLSPKYQNAMHQYLENTLRKRVILAEHQISYANYRTELTVKRLKVEAKKAEMEAIEYTVFTLANTQGDPSAPRTTEYQIIHTFVFHLQKNGWVMEEDKVFDGLIPARPGKEATLIPVPPLAFNKSDDARMDKKGGGSAYLMATIDRESVVDYAYEYWGPTDADYNPAYRNFNNRGEIVPISYLRLFDLAVGQTCQGGIAPHLHGGTTGLEPIRKFFVGVSLRGGGAAEAVS